MASDPTNAFQKIIVKTSDQFDLVARFYPIDNPKKAIFIAGAIGVTQHYYRHMAKFYQSRGYCVMTFDPRGMFESRKEPLAKETADILTWAKIDFDAVLNELATLAPNIPIVWLGHSLGGQVIPLCPSHGLASHYITVTSGSGWWKDNSPELKKIVWALWYGFVPILTPIFGYFPGAKLNMVGDLPKAVITQWRKWCLNPRYLIGVESEEIRKTYADFTSPITSLSFTDDEMMSEASINSLHSFYENSQKTMLRYSPRELGKKRIGHFGFFNADNSDLWERLLIPLIE